jgi:hypothetical protein
MTEDPSSPEGFAEAGRGQRQMNSEGGMRNAENEMTECLIFIISAFRIRTSEFQWPAKAPPV